jgi:hypothetical protein
MEAANVGVILFCPEIPYLNSQIAQGNDRIRRFFGSEQFDKQRINLSKDAIGHRLEVERSRFRSVDDLQHFAETRANDFRLTTPRPVKVVESPEDVMKRLFQRLVGGRAARTARKSRARDLAQEFRHRGVLDRLERGVTVNVPTMGKPLRFPFGYPDDRYQLIEPMAFPAKSGVDTALKAAGQGKLLYRHPTPARGPAQLTIVGTFDANEDQIRGVIQDVSDNEVRLYSAQDLGELIEDIRRSRTAG